MASHHRHSRCLASLVSWAVAHTPLMRSAVQTDGPGTPTPGRPGAICRYLVVTGALRLGSPGAGLRHLPARLPTCKAAMRSAPSMSRSLLEVEGGVQGDEKASRRCASVLERGSATARRSVASQPVLTCDKV